MVYLFIYSMKRGFLFLFLFLFLLSFAFAPSATIQISLGENNQMLTALHTINPSWFPHAGGNHFRGTSAITRDRVCFISNFSSDTTVGGKKMISASFAGLGPGAESGAGINVSRIDNRHIALVCSHAGKMAALRQITDLGDAIVDINIRTPRLDEIYAHFMAGDKPQ